RGFRRLRFAAAGSSRSGDRARAPPGPSPCSVVRRYGAAGAAPETAPRRAAERSQSAGWSEAPPRSSAEQDQRQAAALSRDPGILKTHGFEEFEQLGAGGALLPLAVGLDDAEQIVGSRVALPG